MSWSSSGGSTCVRRSVAPSPTCLLTAPTEFRQIVAHDGPATDYAGITADVLLAFGSRSPRPFRQVCESLAGAVPRSRAVAAPRSSHDAAVIARDGFVRMFSSYFAGGPT